MILIRNIRLLPSERDHAETMLSRAAKRLQISSSEIQSWQIVRRSLDARRKDRIHYLVSPFLKNLLLRLLFWRKEERSLSLYLSMTVQLTRPLRW